MVKMVRRKWLRLSITIVIFVILSVSSFNIFNNGKDIKNSQDFIELLKLEGYNFEFVEVPKGKLEYFESSKEHKAAKIKDTSYINIYDFGTEELAKVTSGTISKDGNRVGRAYVDWGTAVKFYTKGNIIILYEGTDFRMLWQLRIIMGKSIASSPLEYLLFKKYIRKN